MILLSLRDVGVAVEVELTADQRAELQALTTGTEVSAAVGTRARIVLWHAEGRMKKDVAPPEGLSTLGFDPARFQTEPPACYRASWQLTGPDFHRQATTSLRPRSTTRVHLQVCWTHEGARLPAAAGFWC